jgi:hypothetical protein
MTTDGAANERGAARLLVDEGNEVHCSAHNVQLVINDNIDAKLAHASPACAVHRGVVHKGHLLVTHLNGHKVVRQGFLELIKTKQGGAESEQYPPPSHLRLLILDSNYQALVTNTETRWDSELALLERLVYFDTEIMVLYGNPDNGITAEMMMDRFEFDLAFGMTLVLTPFRLFTKAVQYRNRVTTAFIPHLLDDLVAQLAPGTFAQRLLGRAQGVLAQVEVFQSHLVAGIRRRFADVFTEGSIALAAAYLLPGPNPLQFANFPFEGGLEESVINRILDDVIALMPPDSTQQQKLRRRALAASALAEARAVLDEEDPSVDPLKWWPSHGDYRSLFDAVKMYLAIPASTADNERVFSSAGFLLNQRRTRLNLDNFRRESRIRQYITTGNDSTSAVGRQARLKGARTLMERLQEEQLARAQHPERMVEED